MSTHCTHIEKLYQFSKKAYRNENTSTVRFLNPVSKLKKLNTFKNDSAWPNILKTIVTMT